VSFVLLVGAGLMLTSFVRLQRVDPGFETDRILSMRLSPNYQRIPDMDTLMADLDVLGERILREVTAITGVRTAALTDGFPFRPGSTGPDAVGIEIEGGTSEGLARTVDVDVVSRGYFDTIGQRTLAGRTFLPADRSDAPLVVVVNQSMVDNWFGGDNPLGRRIHVPNSGATAAIVGVVSDVRDFGLDRPPVDKLYASMEQLGFATNLLVRTNAAPMDVFPAVRQTLFGLDPELAVDRVATIDSLRDESVASPRLMTTLLGLLALLALLISAGGIAAMMALAVSQRTNELGIRMALGASRRSVLAMILGQGLGLALAGIALGSIGAVAFSRVLASLPYDTTGTDPLTLAGVALVFIAVAVLACLVPARRATRVDPMVALRHQ
jgi:putative ABC transport system permease protein